MNCSLPGSSVCGILRARILRWVSHCLLQGIFSTQGSNLGLLHCRQTLYHLSHQGSPGFIKGRGTRDQVVNICWILEKAREFQKNICFIDYTKAFDCVKVLSRSAAAAAAKLPQSCPTLGDPIDGSPLGSSVPGILQARTLEWVAISFSNA